MEAEYGRETVEGEVGDRVTGEEVALAVAGVVPEIGDGARRVARSVEGEEIGAEPGLGVSDGLELTHPAAPARLHLVHVGTDRDAVMVGEAGDMAGGFVAVVQHGQRHTAEFIEVVVEVGDGRAGVDEDVAAPALQQETAGPSRSVSERLVGGGPQTWCHWPESARSAGLGAGKLGELVMHGWSPRGQRLRARRRRAGCAPASRQGLRARRRPARRGSRCEARGGAGGRNRRARRRRRW